MATTCGSFQTYRHPNVGNEYGLVLWKTTVTVPTGATTVSVEPANPVAGTVVGVWIDPSTLAAGATIKGYMQSDGISTPTYFVNYTVPNPAVETRSALNARTLVHGKLQVDVASAVAANSFVLYVWVNPYADTSLTLGAGTAAIGKLAANSGVDIGDVTLTAGTAIVGKVGIDQTTPGTTNGVQVANPLTAVTATIAESGSLSDEIDLGAGRVLCAIDMPADWTAANLTFQASCNTGGTFDNLYDAYGTEKNITAAEDRYIALDDPAFWLGVRYIKVRSGTAASAVNQAAARTIYLLTKPV